MKTEVKKLDENKRELSIEVGGEIVKNKFEEVFKKVGEKAKLAGFRPGHVPRDMLEKHFSGNVHEQVANELIPEIYQQAIEKEGLEALEMPEILDVKLDRNSLSFKAHIEIMPEVAVKEYKGAKISYQSITVTPEEIKRSLDSLKEQRKIDLADDNFAKLLGYPSLAELEKSLERQLSVQKENAERQKVEQQVLEQLSKGLDFKLPQSMVNKQLEDLTRRAKVELAMRGFAKEQIAEQEKKFSEELQSQARNQVKIYLILAAIAKKENISLDDHMPHQVMEFIFKHANWQTT